MSFHEPDDDEDWYDDEDDLDAVELGPCPECGAVLYDFSDRCPACGYWLSDADGRTLGAGATKPLWVRATVAIVLAAFVLSALGLATALF